MLSHEQVAVAEVVLPLILLVVQLMAVAEVLLIQTQQQDHRTLAAAEVLLAEAWQLQDKVVQVLY